MSYARKAVHSCLPSSRWRRSPSSSSSASRLAETADWSLIDLCRRIYNGQTAHADDEQSMCGDGGGADALPRYSQPVTSQSFLAAAAAAVDVSCTLLLLPVCLC